MAAVMGMLPNDTLSGQCRRFEQVEILQAV